MALKDYGSQNVDIKCVTTEHIEVLQYMEK